MTEILTFSAVEAEPDRVDVLANQGIPPTKTLSVATQEVYLAAHDLFARTIQPAGILAEVSHHEFAAIYQGEGRNEPATPVGDIFARADHLALYAATVGQQVSNGIAECFRSNEFALGTMLDSFASAAADKLGELIRSRFVQMLSERGRTKPDIGALTYSPGYCGWHISGQKKLFDFLKPEQIGISLTKSFLMRPLKSVSGVVIVGRGSIHEFQDAYPFCKECRTHGCRDRIASHANH